ncbi:hypothetical protein [Candidatus Poriferisodalis sp.]|uniref:hypothetical protein n=1 Tax=Candidatus Poriferisodalis sp. TaxID=3101277 RepID=UPI003B0178F7
MAEEGSSVAKRKRWIRRMVAACAEDDRRLIESLQGTDWQARRGPEVASILALADAFPPRKKTELSYPLFPRR